jgi:hypothetical protein
MKKILISFAAFLILGSSEALQAQDQQSQDDVQQQSSDDQHEVARISLIQGDVSTERGDNSQWAAATVNTPVVSGDSVSTGANARTELQLDASDVLRVADNSSAKVASLSRQQIQVQVGQGLVTYTVLRPSDAAAEIDTPNVAVRPRGQGEYRILVDNNGQTQVIVRNGSADVSTPQGSTTVDAGQMITVQGTDNPQYQTSAAPARDEWDSWNAGRDRSILSARSWSDTNRYYTGSEDLDPYGTWSEVPDYGRVWVPRAAPGWAPYRDGRWVYEPYYGWTWVSYEPWGWAPYHYGRWFVYGGNWVWWPGPVAVYPAYYPVWSPAYVSFFGFGGGGFGFGFGFGSGFGRVGWLPIGPCDWYHPWYGRFGGRVNVVNITNIHNTTIINNGVAPLARGGAHTFSNINEFSNNARIRSGFSSMDGKDFGRTSVPSRQQAINESSLRQANLITGKMPVSPTRESFSPSGRAASPSTIRNSKESAQHFFSAPHNVPVSNSVASRFTTNSATHAAPQVRTQPITTAPRTNTSFNRQASTAPASTRSGSVAPSGGQWHSFTPPKTPSRGNSSPSFPSGGTSAANPRINQSHNSNVPSGNWHGFTPQARQAEPPAPRSGFSAPNNSSRQFQPPPAVSQRNYSTHSSRPPLNMRQPIVTPRTGSSPSYSAPRGNGGGSYHPPANSSHGGNSGGGYRAPANTNRGGSGGNGGGNGSSHNGGGSHGGRSH